MSSTEKALIEARNLKKYFKTPQGILHAVDDVSFTIPEGKTLGVVGESGCGKSTLGRTLTRLLPATAGEVYLDGQDIFQLKGKALRDLSCQIQMIFQDPYSSVDPRMTVSQSIAEPLRIHRMFRDKADLQARVLELMDTVGLAERFYHSYPHELDGGRRQRIGIARALSVTPRFIVCDEPVSALDVSIQAQILNLLMDLQEKENLTYLFISHDLSVVKHISERIAVMYLGQCIELAPSQELFANPLHPYTKALIAAIPTPNLARRGKPREIIRGELSSPIDPKPGCRFCSRCKEAGDLCKKTDCCMTEVSSGHFVACHLFRSQGAAL